MIQWIKSPTISGKATQYYVGGNLAYSDVLWNNHLIGDLSSQGLPDTNHTLVPLLHNFTYDVYFYGNNLGGVTGARVRCEPILRRHGIYVGT
jgi:hypothetical protein